MANPERPIEFDKVTATGEYIWSLKSAIKYFGKEIFWMSSDGEYMYLASPNGGKASLAQWQSMTLDEQFNACNSWALMRTGVHSDVNGEYSVDFYGLMLGAPLIATVHQFPFEDAEANGMTPKSLALDSLLQFELGLHTDVIEDYAAVENALHDLGHEVAHLRREYCEREVGILSLAAELRRMLDNPEEQ